MSSVVGVTEVIGCCKGCGSELYADEVDEDGLSVCCSEPVAPFDDQAVQRLRDTDEEE